MKIAEPKKDFNDVETRDIFSQSSVSLDKAEELAPWAILYNEYKELFSLKCEFHLNKERMGSILHDVPLVHDDVLLTVLDNHILINDLHSVKLSIFLEATQEDLRKTA